MELKEISTEEFDWIYSGIEDNFIRSERRPYNSAKKVFKKGEAKFYHAVSSGNKIGLICLWELDGFCFIEYLVVYDKYRNLGYGSEILSVIKTRWENIVLEAEPPISQIAERRLAFYEKNGFKINTFPYFQPTYHKDEDGIELKLLSCPNYISEPNDAINKIYKKVYGK